MSHSRPTSAITRLFHRLIVILGAVSLTLVFFLVLPLIQAIGKPPAADRILTAVETVEMPPPPPPETKEPEPEPEPEKEPPKMEDEAPPLDLNQLELALNSDFSAGWGLELTHQLGGGLGGGGDGEDLFSATDLDQEPRPLYQPSPVLNAKLKKKTPGKVNVIFVVNRDGKVETPVVQSSTDPVFDRPTLAAVKKWKFSPGKRNGKPVRFRMRIPITFRKET